MNKFPQPSRVYSSAFYRGCDIRLSNYEVTKAKYERVKPLRGQRVKHGITDHRPLTDRHRTFEVMYKFGDMYGMAFARVYPSAHSRDPQTGKTTVTQYFSEYKPLLMIAPDGRYHFTPQWMNSFTTWELLGALLPIGLSYTKYNAKHYVCADQPDGTKKYYWQDGQSMSFVPYESNGKTYYEVIGGLPESKVLIDRVKTKKVYENLKPFLDYYEVMSPFVDVVDSSGYQHYLFKTEMRDKLDNMDWLIRNEGEEYGEKWMEAVESLFHTHTHFDHRWEGNKHTVAVTAPDRRFIESKLKGAYLYRVTRPYKQVAVDVGVPFYSNGRKMK